MTYPSMATIPGHSLTLEPMGKWIKKKSNLDWTQIVHEWSLDDLLQSFVGFFMCIRNPRWQPTQYKLYHKPLHLFLNKLYNKISPGDIILTPRLTSSSSVWSNSTVKMSPGHIILTRKSDKFFTCLIFLKVTQIFNSYSITITVRRKLSTSWKL